MTDIENKVVVVKVHRNTAGTQIPFDKLYFFPKSKADAIPKIFGYALVFPCEDSLMAEITQLRPRALSAYRHRRDDTLLGQKVDLDGRTHKAPEIAAWWQDNILTPYNLRDRVIVVPILTSKIRKKINPRYLTTPKWFGKTPREKPRRGRRARGSLPVVESSRVAISDFAYLATPLEAPNDKINPICNICPRQLLQLQGACTPGQSICLKSLNFNEIGKERPLDASVPAEEQEDQLEEDQMASDACEEEDEI